MRRGFNGGRGWGYKPQRGEASRGGRETSGRDDGESKERFDSKHMRGSSSRPPPWLRGRDIGLWHAQQQREKRSEQEEIIQRPRIAFENSGELLRALDRMTAELGVDKKMKTETFRPSNVDVIWRRQPKTSQPRTTAKAACNNADDAPMEVEEVMDDFQGRVLTNTGRHTTGPPKGPFETTRRGTLEAAALKDSDDFVDDDAKEYSEFAINPLDEKCTEALFGSSALSKDPFVDTSLTLDLKRKRASSQVQKLLEFRRKLPAFQRKDEFVEMVKKHRVVVVSGLTGCGKSTQLPQAVLDDQIKRGNGSGMYLVCTQPRRISAISLAERVSNERGENLNSPGNARSVGYQIRLESRLPRDQGSLLYCTTGIVLRWWTSDPTLKRATHLFLDEIHERDVQSDLLLILIRDLLKQRLDLRVILMSATLEAESFLNYFSEFGAGLFEVPGRSFPVQRFYLEDVYEKTRYRSDDKTRRGNGRKRNLEEERRREQALKSLRSMGYSSQTISELSKWREDEDVNVDLILQLVRHLCETSTEKDKEGAILIFVPGMKEIKILLKEFYRDGYFAGSQFKLLPLHSMLSTVDQRAVFERPPRGCRKIIVSTNLAETSVTIDDVVFVIDSGREKRENFDKTLNCQILKPEWVAKANAIQRRGRAGRCQPGVCYHLFPSWKYEQMDERPEPEIRRTRLTSLCLDIKALTSKPSGHGGEQLSVLNFLRKAMDPPDEESVILALDDLYAIGALTNEEILTPLGWHLTKLPVDPHCGKMMIYSVLFSCVDPVLTIAACLDYRSPFYQPFNQEEEVDERKRALRWPKSYVKSDYLMWVNAYNSWSEFEPGYEARRFARDNFLSTATLEFIRKLRRQFAELLHTAGFMPSSDPSDERFNTNSWMPKVIEAVIAAGLYPKVAFVKKQTDSHKADRNFRPPVLAIKNGQTVKIHPSSVNSKEPSFETRYLVYQVAVKSSSYYLHENSMASPLALCLAAGHMQRIVDPTGIFTITLDDWIKFNADKDAHKILKKLRQLLHALFEKHTVNPSADFRQTVNAELQMKVMDLVCTELRRERVRFV